MVDKTEIVIKITALAVIFYMLISALYLYVALGERWDLVLSSLFNERVHGAIMISIVSAFIVGALAIAAAIPIAYILAYSNFRGKHILETFLVDLPQTFPPVTGGLVYLLMFRPLGLAYTFAAVIIAKFYVSAPFAISFAVRRFSEIKESGIDIIARSLGARASHILGKVLLPLSLRDLAAGFSLTWARAMGEMGATLVFSGAIPWVTETLPILVYLSSMESVETAIAASIIAESLSILSLFLFRFIARKSE
ncbi:MAG: ABC transporter permease subunit [Candidatus Bathyarchaeia archaeon]